jgi:hypothetical protein
MGKKQAVVVEKDLSASKRSDLWIHPVFFFDQHVAIRRILIIILTVIILGIPIPYRLYYAAFTTHSYLLPYLLKSEVNIMQSYHSCEESMGSIIFKFDSEYYHDIQKEFNISDEVMVDYIRQWMCVVPPNDYEGYMRSILAFNREHHASVNHEDEDSYVNFYDKKSQDIINAVYQKVDSEPLLSEL